MERVGAEVKRKHPNIGGVCVGGDVRPDEAEEAAGVKIRGEDLAGELAGDDARQARAGSHLQDHLVLEQSRSLVQNPVGDQKSSPPYLQPYQVER